MSNKFLRRVPVRKEEFFNQLHAHNLTLKEMCKNLSYTRRYINSQLEKGELTITVVNDIRDSYGIDFEVNHE